MRAFEWTYELTPRLRFAGLSCSGTTVLRPKFSGGVCITSQDNGVEARNGWGIVRALFLPLSN